MRKSFVLLIVALIFGCDVYSQTYGVLPTAENNYPTVTITQKNYDTLVEAYIKSNQMKLIAKEEAEKMFSDYTTHVNSIISLIGVILTLLGGTVAFFIPYMTNKRYEEKIEEKINAIQEGMSKHNKKIEDSEQTLSNYDTKLSGYDEKIAKSVQTLSDYDKKLADCDQKIAKSEQTLSDYD